VFLLKCQALLQDSGPWADAFGQIIQGEQDGKKPGAIGNYIMEGMVDQKLMGRMASELIRAFSFHIVWQSNEEGVFTPEFVASQCILLRKLLFIYTSVSNILVLFCETVLKVVQRSGSSSSSLY